MIDLTVLDVGSRQASTETSAGLRATLREADTRSAHSRGKSGIGASHSGSGRRFDGGFFMDGVIQGKQNGDVVRLDQDATKPEIPSYEPTMRERAEERRLSDLRANAHAAYDAVQGSHTAALDASLDVLEAELRALRNRCDAHAEMLKAIRLYSNDSDSRELAARGLEDCAGILACRKEIEAGCSREKFVRT